MKKIVYCIPSLYNSAGMERVLSLKANYLAEQGYEVVIITVEQMGRKPYFHLDSRIKLYDLGINYIENNGASIWHKTYYFPKKQRLHRQRLAKLLSELKANVVISMGGFELPFLYKIKDGSLKVAECHFTKSRRLQHQRKGLWRWADAYRDYKDSLAVRHYDHFVVLTEEDKALWGDLPNIRVIPNPLTFQSHRRADTGSQRVIAVGRFDFQKNFEALLRIWAKVSPQHPNWLLDIYGGGEDRQRLRQLIKELALNHTASLHEPTPAIKEEYLTSSIYAMTSRYEGLPMVLLEAQAVGLPIVSYACPCGPRDVITEGEDGFLIPFGDERLFAEKLSLLMADEDLRQRMGQKAKQASQRFQIDEVMKRWTELFA